MKSLRALADRRDPRSLSSMFRRRRAKHLLRLLEAVPRPFTILDIGGEPSFWDTVPLGSGVQVVLLNVEQQDVAAPLRSIAGDARNLREFADQSVDVIVSNSVIEHVGEWPDQLAMAHEVRRVAKRYYVQTPNRWSPVDPHYLIPFVHWLPRSAIVWLLSRWNIGWLTSTGRSEDAELLVRGIRLLSARDLRRLFPEARIWRERVFGITKSLVVYSWPDEGRSPQE